MNLKFSFIVVFFFVFLGAAFSFAEEDVCVERKNKLTESKARSFMKRSKLIRKNEEQNFPELGVQIRWTLLKLLPAKKGCFVIMKICDVSSKAPHCEGGEVEVLGLFPAEEARQDKIVSFEALETSPKRVIAKIGRPGDNPSFYYVELSGKSAVDAYKSHVADTPYFGFSGLAVRESKASFDPTPNRDWRVENAAFSLRRGLSAEAMDVQAFQLDGLDEGGAEGYWKSCQKPRGSENGKCLLAPWSQAFIQGLEHVDF